MKIATFTDIHGNVPALEAIIEDIKKQDFDRIIFLGDAIGLGPKPKECLDLIIKNNIEMVLGNNEIYTLYGIDIAPDLSKEDEVHYKWNKEQLTKEQLDYLSKLPLAIKENINGKKFLFEHFPLVSEDLKQYPFANFNIIKNNEINEIVAKSAFDYTFIGHEHLPFEVEEKGKLLKDIGSSGCIKDNKTFYTIIDVGKDVHITKKELTFDRDRIINDINKTDYPERKILTQIFFGVE